MAYEKLENLSIDELKKRKKTSLILLYLLIGAFILFIFHLLYIWGHQVPLVNLVYLLDVLLVIFLGCALYMLIRKIDKELHGREDK